MKSKQRERPRKLDQIRKRPVCTYGKQKSRYKVDVKTAEEVVYVTMEGREVYAKIAEEVVYVTMVRLEVYAKIAEVVVYVTMVGSEAHAKNVKNADMTNVTVNV